MTRPSSSRAASPLQRAAVCSRDWWKPSSELERIAGIGAASRNREGEKFRLPRPEQRIRKGCYLFSHATLSCFFPALANILSWSDLPRKAVYLWFMAWVAVLASFILYLCWHFRFYEVSIWKTRVIRIGSLMQHLFVKRPSKSETPSDRGNAPRNE